jgi:hypothetical protein
MPHGEREMKLAHGRLYSVYLCMKSRCNKKSHHSYARYGGRGIRVCKEWLGLGSFERFKSWAMAHGYRDELQIDRIDNNDDYCPENCRFVTASENQRNSSNAKLDRFAVSVMKFGLYLHGLGVRKSATLFSVSPSLVCDIRSEKRWRDVPFFN